MSRAPLTLSREMKIGLIALLMLALLGGWLVMNNRQQAALEPMPTPPPVVDSTSSQGKGTDTAAAGQTGTTGSAQGKADGTQTSIPEAPGATGSSSGEAVTAPPFAVTDPNGSTPDPTVPTPIPSGINPDTPLMSLNGHNPFRPNELEAEEGSTQASEITASQPGGAGETPAVTISQPSSSASQINDALATTNSGAIPVSAIPGANNSQGSSSSDSGVVPVTPIPGTTVTTPNPTIPSRTTSSGSSGPSRTSAANTPSSTISIPGGGNNAGTRGPGTGSAAQQPNQPAVPPITAVREPSVTIPGALNQPASTAVQGADSSGLGTTGSMAQPTDPQAITDTSSATQATTQDVQNELETYVKNHQMVFDAAVLGPVNTAIFRTDRGFVIATAGQTLADSRVTLKEVTASTATLALGQDTITLQLDKR